VTQRGRFCISLVIFIGLAVCYSLITPIFEAPDEVWHYAYVRYLVEQRALPPLDDAGTGAYQEVAQPPLFYAVAGLMSGWVSDDDLVELMWHNPGFGYHASGTVSDNKNMLVHTDRERLPGAGAVLAIRLARCASLAFGVLAVIAAWGLGREAFRNQPGLALGVAGVVAFTPQFLFISGVVSNDSAATALATCAVWALARVVNRGMKLRRTLVVGVLIGLAALAKTSNLLLWPLAGAVLCLAVRPRIDRDQPFQRLWPGLGRALLALSVAVLVSGWWYLRNALVYGDPLGVGVHVDTPWGRQQPASLLTLVGELPKVYRSFWGAFGWGHVEYPTVVYWVLGGFIALSLVGWIAAWRRAQSSGQCWVFLLSVTWCSLVVAALAQWMRQVEAPHGRLLFPAIGAWAVLVVGGWAALPRPRLTRFISSPLALIVGALTVLSLLTPWLVIRPAFAHPRLITRDKAEEMVGVRDLTYDGTARLIGVRPDRTTALPGDTWIVRACWEAIAPMSADYTVLVHLVGRDNVRVGERHTYPGLGRFPTSLWPVGRAFCDEYRVQVEPWAPVPELYDIVIGLYDASTGQRLVTQDVHGARVEYAVVEQLRVAPDQPVTVSPEHAADYQLGTGIRLIGYDVSSVVAAGDPLTVTLYWRADEQPDGSYTAFVHLLDADGQQVAQHDSLPRYGRYPTQAWRVGDVVPDEHVLSIPPTASDNLLMDRRVRLVAGMYDADTLERLLAADSDGPLTDNLIRLTYP